MEQNEIDIYEILKNVPSGTEFYSPLCGKVEFNSLAANKEAMEAIIANNRNGIYSFNKFGKYMDEGEVLLFPSKENRDWEEFAESMKPAFELGKLYVFYEEDEDGELTIVGRLIRKNEDEDTLTFGNQLEQETDNFVTDQAFDLRISAHKELRGATPMEEEAFSKAEYNWHCKQGKLRAEAELNEHEFETFEKVLVRNADKQMWMPAIYVRTREAKNEYKFNALLLVSGSVGDFIYCIPYEGNESLAFVADNF